MSLEHRYSLRSAANHAPCFTDLVIQHFAAQSENANVTFTYALTGLVRTPLLGNLPFWARIPVKCAIAVGLGFNPGDCAEIILHGMLGTDQGWRRVDSKGEMVTKKKQVDERMIDKVWQHTSQMIHCNQ
jgi:hypothetical protein